MIEEAAEVNQNNILLERRKRIFSLRNLVFFAISVYLIYILLKNTDFSQGLRLVKNINIFYIAVSLMLYALSNYLKTLRFSLLLKEYSLDIKQLFVIVSYQNFFNLILPARTGELTLIYYLKKLSKINLSTGLYSLLLSRIVDLIVVAMIFIISSIARWGFNFSYTLFFSASAVLVISVFCMFKLDLIIRIMRLLFFKISVVMKIHDKKIIRNILSRADSFYEELLLIQSAKNYLKVTALTVCIWLNLYLIFYYNIKAFIDTIPYNDVLIGATGAVLTNVLPVNSFGSFGTLEAGWTGGFLLVGMSLPDAIMTGFGSHFIMLISAAIIAAICKIYFYLTSKAE